LLGLGLHLLAVQAILPRDDEAFIGWQGEQSGSRAFSGKPGSSTANKKWVEIVSWRPRAYIFHNFLSFEEARHIKTLAAPTMRRSTVVGANGSSVLDDYRTSYGTFIKRKTDPVVEAIEERVAAWAKIPPVHAEDMQVLRYGIGQQYKPHMDTLHDETAGARVATVLLYLNDVEEGGETAFPDSNKWVFPEQATRQGSFSPCAAGSVAFKPKKGDALMFWSIHPNGKSEDPLSMHTGCPVLKGIKWTATKWIHAKPFRPTTYGKLENPDPDPGLCKDAEERCTDWAEKGECQKNPGFMVGDVGAPGRCRRSCKACTPCADGDVVCYDQNRQQSGYLVYNQAELDG